MITHRAKLRRLAFILCPCSARKAESRGPIRARKFASPIPANVGARMPPAKGTDARTSSPVSFITLIRKALLAAFRHGCGAAARRGRPPKSPAGGTFDRNPVAIERHERARQRPAQPRGSPPPLLVK